MFLSLASPFLVLLLLLLDYTVALSPGSQTISLTALSRRQPRTELLRRRGLGATSVPLKGYFNQTELQWFGQIQVGTPPQNFTVVFDTGSRDIEIPGKNCTQACEGQHLFDGDASTTFVSLVDKIGVQSIPFATCLGVSPVTAITPCNMTVVGATDTVIVGNIAVKDVGFWMIVNQDEAFLNPDFDGILGLANAEGSWFKGAIGQGLPSLFGLALTGHDTGSNAELTLGGIDTSKFSDPINFVAVPSAEQDGWIIPSTGVRVNGNTSDILDQTFNVFFDSGTSNVVLPKNMTEAIYSLISPDIKPYTPLPGTYGLPCSKISSLPAAIEFSFNSMEGKPFTLAIPSSELNLGPFNIVNDNKTCQTLINSWSDLQPFPPIVGASLLKHYYSVWDNGRERIGFSPLCNQSACSGPSLPSSSVHSFSTSGVLAFILLIASVLVMDC